jgi:BASS family bile acid:Na+ symporter
MFFVRGAAAYGLARLAGLGYAQTTSITSEVGIQNATLGMTVGALMVGQPELLPPYSLPAAVYGALMYVLVLPFVFWRRQHVAPAKAGRDVTA